MVRNRSIIATTTATLEGYETTGYLGVVSAHVVAGTGLFSDVLASFSDLFGGRSRSYQKQLAAINDEVIDLLKSKAAALGANAVLGLRLDHDEIAGGGKSMFMVTATGTAAVTEQSRRSDRSATGPSGVLSADDLSALVRRQYLVQAAENGKLRLNDETWEFLIVNRVGEVAPVILATVMRSQREPYNFPDTFIGRSVAYFQSLPDDELKTHLYPVIAGGEEPMRKYALNIIGVLNLLDFDEVENMLRSDRFETRKRALDLLLLDKSRYSVADAGALDMLREKVESSFGKRGQVVEVEQRFLSKTKQKWECDCGAVVAMEVEYCPECDFDIYGFGREETRPESVVDLMVRRANMLRAALVGERARHPE